MIDMSVKTIVSCFAIIVRVLVGIHPHSGQGDDHGKMAAYGGDFEAQRHWMEITLHLPISDWYSHDLDYWGLDYPPLTAYISYICGWMSDLFVGSESVALYTSRGYEDIEFHKPFMRMTVLVLDLVIYFSAVWAIASRKRDFASSSFLRTSSYYHGIILALIQPAIILIDHGHFQYNTVALGLSLWSFHYMTKDVDENSFRNCIAGSILFCLALNFKQMTLYYAIPVFTYLLGRCYSCEFSSSSSTIATIAPVFQVLKLGIAVCGTFGVLWCPFLIFRDQATSVRSVVLNILLRLFPFQRGLFEGKVSNIWFALSVKPLSIRSRLSAETLPKYATFLTLLMVVPPSILLFVVGKNKGKIVVKMEEKELIRTVQKEPAHPSLKDGTATTPIKSQKSGDMDRSSHHLLCLLWGTTTSSLGFFLASYQVHEKSILLALSPLSVLLFFRNTKNEVDVKTDTEYIFICWFSIMTVWTLFPLIQTDRLVLAYWSCIAMFSLVATIKPCNASRNGSSTFVAQRKSDKVPYDRLEQLTIQAILLLSSIIMLALHGLELIVDAPRLLPDLYPVLWSLFGCAMYIFSWIFCSYKLFRSSVAAYQFENGSDNCQIMNGSTNKHNVNSSLSDPQEKKKLE